MKPHFKRRTGMFVTLFAAAAMFTAILLTAREQTSTTKVEVRALSSDPARVTGGDVLLQISLPRNISARAARVAVDGRDVTDVFKRTSPRTLLGVVTGLANGKNTVTVSTKAARTDASLEVTNYPISGPVFS